MGFFDSWSDLVAAVTPWSESEAEAVKGDAGTDSTPVQGQEKDEGEPKCTEYGNRAYGHCCRAKANELVIQESDEEAEAEEPEEEEEEEEMVDPKEKFEEECKESKQCSPAKHHFDDCVERVTGASDSDDKKAPHEDCVEEFFHLAHCASACAAPKVWSALK
ncbi:ubiquinol-cytochrome C reductase hinge protein-domain-containing protein [Tricladium varicosporioides]|nr:ubiquinol-cytochrome C reductase hinge protein-domain-containing protein [Hymenoscyphus varicosporioides]